METNSFRDIPTYLSIGNFHIIFSFYNSRNCYLTDVLELVFVNVLSPPPPL